MSFSINSTRSKIGEFHLRLWTFLHECYKKFSFTYSGSSHYNFIGGSSDLGCFLVGEFVSRG